MTVTKWKNDGPKEYYKTCIKLFGEPDVIANVPDGIAIWKTKGLFSEHILRDETVKHCAPRNHVDYFYSSVKFFIPKDKLFDVLKITGSINYDGLKKLLTARCATIEANYATLYLGMLVANGELNIKDVKKNDLYKRHIYGEELAYKEMKSNMIKLKRNNSKKYKKELKLNYAPYAFDECYQG